MYLPLPFHFLMTAETTPLLENSNGHSNRTSFIQKVSSVLRANGEPGLLASSKFLLLSSWFNILLVFIPLSILSEQLDWDAGLRFGFSFVAIIPLAKVSQPFGR
jgi:Ca2+:H+ antiporter